MLRRIDPGGVQPGAQPQTASAKFAGGSGASAELLINCNCLFVLQGWCSLSQCCSQAETRCGPCQKALVFHIFSEREIMESYCLHAFYMEHKLQILSFFLRVNFVCVRLRLQCLAPKITTVLILLRLVSSLLTGNLV